MTAQELRIGNWIETYAVLSDGIGAISSPTVSQKQATWEDIKIISEAPLLATYRPIPLSASILEKCGFEKLKGAKDVYKIEANGVEISVNTKLHLVYIETDFGHARINNLQYPHLHNLQNLIFALTQTELKIEL